MKYLIFGKDGQLAREFLKSLSNKNVFALSHGECDISDLKKVVEVFEHVRPDIVINCAAYNMVDMAETEYFQAYKTNALGVKCIAYASKKFNTYFISYSTDYVFDGKKEGSLYTEEDKPCPLNEYGKSKFTGERWVLEEELSRYLIFRTSWVYGDGTQNFISKLIKWSKNNDYLKIAYDEISVPTSTHTIKDVTIKAIKEGLTGLYHLTNSGFASRYEWAKKIFEIKKIKKFIYPVSKEIFNLPAKRPKFSAMDNEKITSMLSIEIPLWDEELRLRLG